MDVKMIYDCFTFHNEFDLLEIRLNELAGVVDCFILVEANTTFAGNPKPYYFDENKSRFDKFPIHHVTIDMTGSENASAWDRERYQRNMITEAVLSEMPDETDVIMIGDVDEIPRRQIILDMEKYNFGGHFSLLMKAYQYHVNNINVGFVWPGTQVVPMWMLYENTPEEIRNKRYMVPWISDAGWHYSSMVGKRGADAVREKLQSFSHTECDKPEWTNTDHLNEAIASGQDPCGRTDVHFAVTQEDDYPDYLRANRDKFAYMWR
jgi:beta-1,4-mannosyl-glycoprotein beta-1,4-N-acetylglucosaminyltransferase